METLNKIWGGIKEDGFIKWISKWQNFKVACLLLFLVIDIIAVGYSVYLFIKTILATDENIVIYIGLLIVYAFGITHQLYENIAFKSRKITRIINGNSNNFEKKLRDIDYISLCSCIAKVTRDLSSMIAIFMFNLAWDLLKLEKIDQNEVTMAVYVTIVMVTVFSSIAVILKGFIFTDAMILVNNGSGIKRKVKKLEKKYKK